MFGKDLSMLLPEINEDLHVKSVYLWKVTEQASGLKLYLKRDYGTGVVM